MTNCVIYSYYTTISETKSLRFRFWRRWNRRTFSTKSDFAHAIDASPLKHLQQQQQKHQRPLLQTNTCNQMRNTSKILFDKITFRALLWLVVNFSNKCLQLFKSDQPTLNSPVRTSFVRFWSWNVENKNQSKKNFP